MKNLINYIKEGLKLTSKSKINIKRELSLSNIPNDFWNNFTAKTPDDLNDITRDVRLQKFTPEQLIKKVQYKEQLFCYWYEAIIADWEDGYDAFRNEIINKNYADEDTLDACVIDLYLNIAQPDTDLKKFCQKYFEKYNIVIDEKSI